MIMYYLCLLTVDGAYFHFFREVSRFHHTFINLSFIGFQVIILKELL